MEKYNSMPPCTNQSHLKYKVVGDNMRHRVEPRLKGHQHTSFIRRKKLKKWWSGDP